MNEDLQKQVKKAIALFGEYFVSGFGKQMTNRDDYDLYGFELMRGIPEDKWNTMRSMMRLECAYPTWYCIIHQEKENLDIGWGEQPR